MKSNIVELKNISFSYSNKIEVLKNIDEILDSSVEGMNGMRSINV